MTALNPARLVMARNIEQLTQAELSELISVTQHVKIPSARLSRIENGLVECSESEANHIAAALGYPKGFFFGESVALKPLDLTYRRTSKTKVREVNAVVAEYQMLNETVQKVSVKLGMDYRLSWIDKVSPRSIERPLTIREINSIAQLVREQMRIKSHGPVKNMTRVLEHNGILVIPMRSMGEKATYTTTSEGVTAPRVKTGMPVVGYLRRTVTGDRMRFTRAHELGHIVLHAFDRNLAKEQMEQEAHLFAGAFLMPEEDAKNAFDERSMLSDYVAAKAGWGVSISAIVMRASALGLISASRKRSLQMQISARGWRKKEPVNVEDEDPILFKQMLGKAYGNLESPTTATVNNFTIESELGVPFRYLDFWANGLNATSEEIGIYERRFAPDGKGMTISGKLMHNDKPAPNDMMK